MNKFFKAAKHAAFSAIPVSVYPSNGYARSFGALMCLAVSADLEFDTEEFQQASIFIERDAKLRSDGTASRAIEYFRGYCATIEKVMNQGSLEFPGIQTELISEVRSCPAEYTTALKRVVEALYQMGGPDEKAIFDRIDL